MTAKSCDILPVVSMTSRMPGGAVCLMFGENNGPWSFRLFDPVRTFALYLLTSFKNFLPAQNTPGME